LTDEAVNRNRAGDACSGDLAVDQAAEGGGIFVRLAPKMT